jgi:hypothetical protein
VIEEQSIERTRVIAALLTQLAGSVDGVVDTGTAICASPEMPNTREFMEWRGTAIMSLAVVVRDLMGALARQGDAEAREGLLETLNRESARFAGAAGLIARCADAGVSLEQVRSATVMLGESHAAIITSARELGRQIGCPLDYLEKRTAERDGYYRGILRGLFDLLCRERGLGKAAQPAPRAAAS